MQVVEMIFYWARTDPDRQAIIQPEIITSYKGLADGIDSVADRLVGLNLDRSAPIAVSIANPVIRLTVLMALARSGYSTASVNRGYYPLLRDAGIHDLIYDLHGQVASGGRNIRLDPSWLPIQRYAKPGERSRPRRREKVTGDIAFVFFTSGTTGLPKKFVLSGAGLDHRVAIQHTLASVTHQKAAIVPRLSGAFGIYRVLEILNAGKTACLAPFGDPVLRLINTFGVDSIVCSPAQALDLVDLLQKSPGYDLRSLQTVMLGGAMVGREALDRIRTTLCRNVISQYSSTEAGIAAAGPYEFLDGIPGAVGFVPPWAELEIVDESGANVANGVEGLVRYRTAMFNESVAINGIGDVHRGQSGWFYPGDVGSITTDGLLCLAGRTSDIINRGGAKISAVRLAEIVEELESVKEAAVCGIDGKSGMEEIWIAIVPKGPVDIAAVKAHVQQSGAIADEVFLVDEIPRNDIGKIQRIRLKDMLLTLNRTKN